jgi:hypothetical protein
MNGINEALKIDIGVVSQTITNSNDTGRYYDMSKYRRALAILNVGAMAASKAAKIEFYQATDASGTGAKLMTSTAAEITANADVAVATVDLTSAAATDVVTINGVDYTMAAGTTAASYTFSSAAGLAADVNNATYGVAGITASATTSVVTLIATDPGEKLLTVSATNGSGTVTVATTQAVAFSEVDVSSMDLANGFTHLAVKATSTATGGVSVVLVRGDARISPTQFVGASASV